MILLILDFCVSAGWNSCVCRRLLYGWSRNCSSKSNSLEAKLFLEILRDCGFSSAYPFEGSISKQIHAIFCKIPPHMPMNIVLTLSAQIQLLCYNSWRTCLLFRQIQEVEILSATPGRSCATELSPHCPTHPQPFYPGGLELDALMSNHPTTS
jgi:hypothetical protein